jgi:hypothetical protein
VICLHAASELGNTGQRHIGRESRVYRSSRNWLARSFQQVRYSCLERPLGRRPRPNRSPSSKLQRKQLYHDISSSIGICKGREPRTVALASTAARESVQETASDGQQAGDTLHTAAAWRTEVTVMVSGTWSKVLMPAWFALLVQLLDQRERKTGQTLVAYALGTDSHRSCPAAVGFRRLSSRAWSPHFLRPPSSKSMPTFHRRARWQGRSRPAAKQRQGGHRHQHPA